WVWSDSAWAYYQPDAELFYKMMPKSVLQSNWYYGEQFDLSKMDDGSRVKRQVQTYLDLEAHGYDQIPTASNDGIFYAHGVNTKSIGNTVDFCTRHVSDSHLKGFLQTLWVPTIEKYRPNIMEGIALAGEARRKYEAIKR